MPNFNLPTANFTVPNSQKTNLFPVFSTDLRKEIIFYSSDIADLNIKPPLTQKSMVFRNGKEIVYASPTLTGQVLCWRSFWTGRKDGQTVYANNMAGLGDATNRSSKSHVLMRIPGIWKDDKKKGQPEYLHDVIMIAGGGKYKAYGLTNMSNDPYPSVASYVTRLGSNLATAEGLSDPVLPQGLFNITIAERQDFDGSPEVLIDTNPIYTFGPQETTYSDAYVGDKYAALNYQFMEQYGVNWIAEGDNS